MFIPKLINLYFFNFSCPILIRIDAAYNIFEYSKYVTTLTPYCTANRSMYNAHLIMYNINIASMILYIVFVHDALQLLLNIICLILSNSFYVYTLFTVCYLRCWGRDTL